MADDDPLQPGYLQQWQYPGQEYGLPNPYAGLDEEGMDPLYQYTFGSEGPIAPPSLYPELFPPQYNPFSQLGPEQGVPSNFGAQLDPNQLGNVEMGATLEDPLMPQLQAGLAAQSTGFAPTGELPASPPWISAVQPGELQSAAGFGDIIGGMTEGTGF